MRHLSRRLPGTSLVALVLCMACLTATAVAGNGNGNNGNGNGNGSNASGSNASGKDKDKDKDKTPPPPPAPAPPPPPPAPAPKAAPAPPSGQAKKTAAGATAATPAAPATDGTPATTTTPAESAAPTPVPPAAAPVIGESMGVKPVKGTVQVRLPQSSGYVSLAAAGSVPSGAVIDAREGTVVLRSAVDAKGRTQDATIRGAVFEVRQSPTGHGMTDLVVKGGRPAGCPSGAAATARAAMAHGIARAKGGSSGGLWARDHSGRFRSRGRNSVATVRGTRWVTRETCAGTLTRVMDGAVDVFDLRKHRTVRVRAGHTYLARTSG
jgi:hypothetical protein